MFTPSGTIIDLEEIAPGEYAPVVTNRLILFLDYAKLFFNTAKTSAGVCAAIVMMVIIVRSLHNI